MIFPTDTEQDTDWYSAKYLKYWCTCDVIPSVIYLTRQTVNSLHQRVYSDISISWYTAALFAQDLPEAFLDSLPEKYFTYSCINNVNRLLTSASQTADPPPKHDTLCIIVHFRVSVELLEGDDSSDKMTTDLQTLSCNFVDFYRFSFLLISPSYGRPKRTKKYWEDKEKLFSLPKLCFLSFSVF